MKELNREMSFDLSNLLAVANKRFPAENASENEQCAENEQKEERWHRTEGIWSGEKHADVIHPRNTEIEQIVDQLGGAGDRTENPAKDEDRRHDRRCL